MKACGEWARWLTHVLWLGPSPVPTGSVTLVPASLSSSHKGGGESPGKVLE